MNALLSSGLALLLVIGAAAAPDARFDGSRALGGAAPVRVDALPRRAEAPLEKPEPKTDEAPAPRPEEPSAPADVAPRSAAGITSGFLGLYPEEEFVLGTGNCSACRAPEQGKWYFPNDVIATPKSGQV